MISLSANTNKSRVRSPKREPFAGRERSERGVATVSCAADGEKRSVLTSVVVGADCAGDAVEPDRVAVRDDPLRSGVSEWHSDADHGFEVISGDARSIIAAITSLLALAYAFISSKSCCSNARFVSSYNARSSASVRRRLRNRR